MKQMIYHSQPFGFDNAMLASILMQARRNNLRDGITGALVCRHDIYLQLIEGPENAIDTLISRLKSDDRHANVQIALQDTVEERMFPEWEMLDDQMPTLTWTPAEIAGGTIARAQADELRAVFRQIATKARGDASPS